MVFYVQEGVDRALLMFIYVAPEMYQLGFYINCSRQAATVAFLRKREWPTIINYGMPI